MLTLISILAMVVLVIILAPKMAEALIPTMQDEALRLEASVTKTADFNGTSKDLGSGYAPGAQGQPMIAVIDVSAGTRADSDETYAFIFEESSDNSTFTACAPSISVTVATTVFTTGVYVAKGYVKQRYVRLRLDVGGTTPSITYEAWLNPLQVA